jgi:hypothetical protein
MSRSRNWAAVWLLALTVWMPAPADGQDRSTINLPAEAVEDTYLSSARRGATRTLGGAEQLVLGSDRRFGTQRALVRIDLSQIDGSYDAIEALTLRLPVLEAGGDWSDQPLRVELVAPANADWSAGADERGAEAGSAMWAYRRYSDVRNVQSGEAEHQGWAGAPGLGEPGVDYLSEPVAELVVNPDDGGWLDVVIDDADLLSQWAQDPGANSGLLLTMPGLENAGGTLVLASADAAERRPQASVRLRGYRPESGTPIRFELPEAAQVSLLITDAQGSVVRELMHARAFDAGQHTIIWNGANDSGQPVEPGDYRWRLLHTQGLQAEYLMTLGLSVDHHELWPGNHIGVSGVAVDERGVYLSSGCSEARGFTLMMRPDGERVWTNREFWFDAWQGGHSVAIDGQDLYLLQENHVVQRLSAEDGQGRRARFDVVYDRNAERARPVSSWDQMKRNTVHRTARVDMDARDGALAVSYQDFDAVRWIDGDSGEVLAEAAVPEPLGVALTDGGDVLVISGGAVLRVTRDGQTTTHIPADQLDGPERLSVVPGGDGELLVAEGEPSHQVHRFSAEGELVQTYGREGGRPAEGVYDGSVGFLHMTDIAAAADGSFWIAEAFSAPRRVAHFAGDGGLVREWYGPQMYANRASIDPADPTIVWMDSHWGTLIRARLDYENRSWEVLGTYSYMHPLQPRYVHTGGMWFVRHREGVTYLVRENELSIMRFDEQADRLLPVTQVGTAFYPGGNSGWRIPEAYRPTPEQWDEQAARQRDPGDERSHRPWMFAWHDVDNDGQIQREEMRFYRNLYRWKKTAFVTDDLTFITGINGNWKHDGRWQQLDQRGMTRLPAERWDGLAPTYDYVDGGEFIFENPPVRVGGNVGYWMDDDGAVYSGFNNSRTRRDGSEGRSISAVRWNPDGSFAWAVGQHQARGVPVAGHATQLYRMAGTAHDTVAINSIHHGQTHSWDRDGLWVGNLLDNPVLSDDVPAEAYRLCGENFGGYLVAEPGRDDAAIFLGGTQNATGVYRITGYDRFGRLSGEVTLGD